MDNNKECCSVPKTENSEVKTEIKTIKQKQHNKGIISWGSITITAVLSILTLFTLAQTVQTATILNKVKSSNFGSGSSSLNSASLQDLPDMVGGC